MAGFVSYADAAGQARALAALVAGELATALAARDRCLLAVPGGRTPGPFLAGLTGAALDWDRVTVLATDERQVPEASPRSNTGQLRAVFASTGAEVAALADLDEAALQARLPVDVCVLGMGADGHVASLFPGGDTLDVALDPACPRARIELRAPGSVEPRLTLTAPVLLGAGRIHLLIAGADKKAVYERAEGPGPVSDLPVRLLIRGRPDLQVHWTADTGGMAWA
jgi:6-phosphogluconolactonase